MASGQYANGKTGAQYQAERRARMKQEGTYRAFRWKHHLRGRYGLTVEQYDEMYESQKGCCLICCEPGKLHVDHNHETKEVRGLLCSLCNVGLGHFRERPDLLTAAIDYLNRPPLA